MDPPGFRSGFRLSGSSSPSISKRVFGLTDPCFYRWKMGSERILGASVDGP